MNKWILLTENEKCRDHCLINISTFSPWCSATSRIILFFFFFELCSLIVGGFLCGSVGKESACNAGDLGSIPGLGRSPGEGNGNPLHYSCLGNPMDRGAWWATVHGVVRVGYDWATSLSLSWIIAVTVQGNGTRNFYHWQHLLKTSLRHFPGGPVVKNVPCNAGDAGSIPGQETK